MTVYFLLTALIIAGVIVVPDWFVTAKGHLTSLTLTGQTETISVSGNTLADGTAVILSGRLSSFGVQLSPVKSNINTITSPRGNNVVIEDNFSLQIDVLKVNGGTNVDALRRMILGHSGTGAAVGYNHFKVSWVEGTLATMIDTITCYGSRGEYSFNAGGKAEVIASLSIDCVDPGAADFFTVVRS